MAGRIDITAEAPAFGAADLSSCDREPIHIPGSVQPHGLLLVLHPESLTLLQYAGDASLLPGGGDLQPGMAVGALLPDGALCEIAAVAAETAMLPPRAVECDLPKGSRIGLLLHRAAAGIMVELERMPEDAPSARLSPLPIVQTMMARLQAAATPVDFCQAATQEVRRVTGFDRVMVYRFLPDESGEVVAEARAPGQDSFLGLRYPASDIPRQARALYLRNWLRLIPDAGYQPAPLRPAINPLTGATPDLSFCVLRSVSPVHLQYLRNMGVRASMSLSILRGGALWGLIACHHDTPRHLPAALRAACELFAQMFSLQLQAQEQAEDFGYASRLRRVHEGLVQLMAGEEALAFGLIKHRPNLLDFIAADGVALLIDGNYATAGRVPEEAAVRALAAWLGEAGTEGVVAMDQLPSVYPPAAGFAALGSGILALSVSRTPRDYIIWFRPELLQTVTWAGNPDKPVESLPGCSILTPRRSFAAWQESVRGRSAPWRTVEVEAARGLRVSLLEVVLRRIDQLCGERAKAKEAQDFLIAELDHRVKNSLAVILALVRHSSGSAASVDGFVTDLQSRLHAMAHAHALLADGRWEGAGLRVLVTEALRGPGGGQGFDGRITVAGPTIRLGPKAALALGMALHELATNAAKHGALSRPGGSVAVGWALGDTTLRLEWRESGGPPVLPPTRRGFGMAMIERSLAYEVGGHSRLDFAPDGLRCCIDLPLHHIAGMPATARPAAPRVLVLEAAAPAAEAVAAALTAAGMQVIGPVGRVHDALALLRDAEVDAALLGVGQEPEQVFAVADLLAARHLPFALTLPAAGAGAPPALPARFAGIGLLRQPYNAVAAVAALLAAPPPG
jgi:light-regulated signal transduction histidine kinase (bacteriophytochrome)